MNLFLLKEIRTTIKMKDMITVNGFFENGRVELSEPVVGVSRKSKVIVTFLDAEIVFGGGFVLESN